MWRVNVNQMSLTVPDHAAGRAWVAGESREMVDAALKVSERVVGVRVL